MLAAVDIGNSKTDLVLLSPDGVVRRWFRTGEITPTAIGDDGTAAALAGLLPGDARLEATWVGAAGVDFPDEEESLTAALVRRGVFGEVTVRNDIHALLACVRDTTAGIAVVAGAGMNMVGVDGPTEVRFAALGFASGDRGGGYHLGLQALAAACRAADGRGPQTSLQEALLRHHDLPDMDAVSRAVAAGRIPWTGVVRTAELVFDQARAGDPEAARIVREQADEVVICIRATAARLGRTPHQQPVALGGSILRHGRDLLEPLIRAGLGPGRPDLRFPDFPPVVGAAAAVLESRGDTSDHRARLAAELARMEPEWRPVAQPLRRAKG